MSRSVKQDYDKLINPPGRTPDRQKTIDYLKLRLAEMRARHEFHLNPTPATLTTWCDANERLENANDIQ